MYILSFAMDRFRAECSLITMSATNTDIRLEMLLSSWYECCCNSGACQGGGGRERVRMVPPPRTHAYYVTLYHVYCDKKTTYCDIAYLTQCLLHQPHLMRLHHASLIFS